MRRGARTSSSRAPLGSEIERLALLGGVFYPAASLDEPWSTLTRLDPLYYLVDATRAASPEHTRGSSGSPWRSPGLCSSALARRRGDHCPRVALKALGRVTPTLRTAAASIVGIEKRAIVPKCGAGLHAWATPASHATERKTNVSSSVKRWPAACASRAGRSCSRRAQATSASRTESGSAGPANCTETRIQNAIAAARRQHRFVALGGAAAYSHGGGL